METVIISLIALSFFGIGLSFWWRERTHRNMIHRNPVVQFESADVARVIKLADERDKRRR